MSPPAASPSLKLPAPSPRHGATIAFAGTVRDVILRKPDGWTSVRLIVDGRSEAVRLITYDGRRIRKGDRIDGTGTWSSYKGDVQINASKIALVPPPSAAGAHACLRDGLLPDVDERLADKLYGKFGAKLPEALLDPVLLSGPGVSAGLAARIASAWDRLPGREALVFLRSYRIPLEAAQEWLASCGAVDAVAAVLRSPWRLCALDGVVFAVADRIARAAAGFEESSPERIRAALHYVLRSSSFSKGHCWIRKRDLVLRAAGRRILDLPDELIAAELEAALLEGAFTTDEGDDDAVWAPEALAQERRLAERLADLALGGPSRCAVKEEALAAICALEGIRLDPTQMEAVRAALAHRVCVVTGGPGSGKTLATRIVVKALEAAGRKAVLAAPTGRAARRLAEATGVSAATIHRLLEWGPERDEHGLPVPGGAVGFQRTAERPIEADAVIIDEGSMLDLVLAWRLLEAIAPAASLILIGDADQLPSVGPGRILADVIDSGVFPVARLGGNHRQAEGSGIILAARRINAGTSPFAPAEGAPAPAGAASGAGLSLPAGCVHVPSEEGEALVRAVVEEALARRGGQAPGGRSDPLSGVQILAAQKTGPVGTEKLNRLIKAEVNPAKPGSRALRRESGDISVGDRVMQTRNNPDLDVYNGEIGVVVGIRGWGAAAEVSVAFPSSEGERIVAFPRDAAVALVLAYAATIHKSQGSEFETVIVPCPQEHGAMLRRNLLYTAVTRAKRVCVLIGSEARIAAAAELPPEPRNTSLAGRLRVVVPPFSGRVSTPRLDWWGPARRTALNRLGRDGASAAMAAAAPAAGPLPASDPAL